MRFLTLCALVTTLSPIAAVSQTSDFRMTVQDIFTVSNEGVFITGTVEGGPVAAGDVLCLRPAEGEQKEVTVDGILNIRQRRQEVETAEPGVIVALRFKDIDDEAAVRGDQLTATCD